MLNVSSYSGVAPGPPVLQAGALLRELSSRSRFFGMVVLPGNAPGSSGYQPGALLLSYRTGKLAEAERVELPRPVRPSRFSRPISTPALRASVDWHPLPDAKSHKLEARS